MGSPLWINSEKMASMEARAGRDHGGAAEMEHGVTAAPTLLPCTAWGKRQKRSGWVGRFTVSSHAPICY